MITIKNKIKRWLNTYGADYFSELKFSVNS